MKLKEMLAAGAIGLSTLSGCGEEQEIQCGTGIQDIQKATWQEVWHYCADTESVGRLGHEDSYVMCPATCTDSPKGCERKYTCAQIWSREDVEGRQIDLKTLNGCTGNSASQCKVKVED
jgi:hypothetical protein